MAGEPALTPAEEQEKWLGTSRNAVKASAFQMKRALDADNLLEALKHASSMLGEMRTALLSPARYYGLFLQATDELRHLALFVEDLSRTGSKSYGALYERVQACGNVVPRLYLLVTIGGVYIQSREAGSKNILRDLVEMCKGVQHPSKGLFLRSHLLQTVRDKLPDTGSVYASGDAGVADAVSFLLDNFTEMNKLWVRMRYQGAAEDAMRREKERGELRELVGKNLTLLSELDGLDMGMYKDTVLPKLLEQVLACKDDLAQSYIMDCIVQRFPDDYHAATYASFFSACRDLQPSVDATRCIAPLLTRLAAHQTALRGAGDAAPAESAPVAGDTFSSLLASIAEVSETRSDMPLDKVCDLFGSMMTYATAVHGASSLAHVDAVLHGCHAALSKRLALNDGGTGVLKERKGVEALSRVLRKPLELTDNPVEAVMNLSGLAKLLACLGGAPRRENAMVVLRRCVERRVSIASDEALGKLYAYLDVLLRDTEGAPELDDEDFLEEQELVARSVHLFEVIAPTPPKEAFAILSNALATFTKGGPRRMIHTLPPLAYAILCFARRLRILSYPQGEGGGEADAKPGGVSLKKVFGMLHEICTQLWEQCAAFGGAEVALRLFLLAGESAVLSGLSAIGEECLTKAFEVYEENVSESHAQFATLGLLTGSLQHIVLGLDRESMDALAQKCTSCSSSLLKKRDQCLAVLRCAHLFWQDNEKDPRVTELEGAVASASGASAEEYANRTPPALGDAMICPVRDSEKVLQCLKRALKSAKAAEQLAGAGGGARKGGEFSDLYLCALNEYVYFYGRGVETVSAADVTALIELVSSEESSGGKLTLPGSETVDLRSVRERTLLHVKRLQASAEEDVAARWRSVVVPS